MPNQDAGDAGGDGSPERDVLVAPLNSDHAPVEAGEVVLAIGDAYKKEKDGAGERETYHQSPDERLEYRARPDSQGCFLRRSLVKVVSGPWHLVQKVLPARRQRRGLGRRGSRMGDQGFWATFYDNALMSPAYSIALSCIVCLVLSMLAFLACIATTKVLLEGCRLRDCKKYFGHHSRSNSSGKMFRGLFPGFHTKKDCVFRRYVPHKHVHFLEIIHDLSSQWSVLIEPRDGERCMLFDMHRYTSASSCPSFYPGSMDERLGVPSSMSQLSLTFPKRFARHRFRPVRGNLRAILKKTGPVIRKRCAQSSVYMATLVEVHAQDRLCRPAIQGVVDKLLERADPSYKVVRSDTLSNHWAITVVLYENVDSKPRQIGEESARGSDSQRKDVKISSPVNETSESDGNEGLGEQESMQNKTKSPDLRDQQEHQTDREKMSNTASSAKTDSNGDRAGEEEFLRKVQSDGDEMKLNSDNDGKDAPPKKGKTFAKEAVDVSKLRVTENEEKDKREPVEADGKNTVDEGLEETDSNGGYKEKREAEPASPENESSTPTGEKAPESEQHDAFSGADGHEVPVPSEDDPSPDHSPADNVVDPLVVGDFFRVGSPMAGQDMPISKTKAGFHSALLTRDRVAIQRNNLALEARRYFMWRGHVTRVCQLHPENWPWPTPAVLPGESPVVLH